MDVKMTTEGSKALFSMAGELSVATAPDLEEALKSMPAELTDIDIDLSEVDYISSAGLRAMILAAKIAEERGGGLTVRNANDDIREVFEMTGLDGVFGD